MREREEVQALLRPQCDGLTVHYRAHRRGLHIRSRHSSTNPSSPRELNLRKTVADEAENRGALHIGVVGGLDHPPVGEGLGEHAPRGVVGEADGPTEGVGADREIAKSPLPSGVIGRNGRRNSFRADRRAPTEVYEGNTVPHYVSARRDAPPSGSCRLRVQKSTLREERQQP